MAMAQSLGCKRRGSLAELAVWACFFGVLSCLAPLGCSDIDVYSLTAVDVLQPPVHTATLTGTYCASDPDHQSFPVKILLVLDDSGSMSGSDATFQRLQATRDLANALIPIGGYYFGIERFQNSQPEMLTQNPFFTDNNSRVQAALSQGLHGPGGGTPYLAALSLATATIQQDITSDPTQASRTRYVVIFFSDGDPTDEMAPYGQIKNQVVTLRSLQGAGDITLHTAYLQDGGVNPQAWQLLQEMAQLGHGEAKSFPSGDSLDFRDYDTSSLAIPFIAIAPLLVTNMNARPGPEGVDTDSDADGLADRIELAIGSDPTLADTDADTCSDLLEHRDFQTDPIDPSDCGCSNEQLVGQDADSDLLNACAEELVGTNDEMPESDLNNSGSEASPDDILDGLEVLWGMLPVRNDARHNYDSDAVNNIEELKDHTDPLRTETPAMRQMLAYRYDIAVWEDKPCYDFVVDNVSLAPTLETHSQRAGENSILLYFIEAPKPTPTHGRQVKLLRLAAHFDPAAERPLTLQVDADTFEAVMPGP